MKVGSLVFGSQAPRFPPFFVQLEHVTLIACPHIAPLSGVKCLLAQDPLIVLRRLCLKLQL